LKGLDAALRISFKPHAQSVRTDGKEMISVDHAGQAN
jgi:hypothetical protein